MSNAYDLADHQYNFLKRIESNINFHDCNADAHRCKRLIDECNKILIVVSGERELDHLMILSALHC